MLVRKALPPGTSSCLFGEYYSFSHLSALFPPRLILSCLLLICLSHLFDFLLLVSLSFSPPTDALSCISILCLLLCVSFFVFPVAPPPSCACGPLPGSLSFPVCSLPACFHASILAAAGTLTTHSSEETCSSCTLPFLSAVIQRVHLSSPQCHSTVAACALVMAPCQDPPHACVAAFLPTSTPGCLCREGLGDFWVESQGH